MSEQPGSLSRRALLRAAGLVPFALLGATPLPKETLAEIDSLEKPTTLTEEEKGKLARIMVNPKHDARKCAVMFVCWKVAAGR